MTEEPVELAIDPELAATLDRAAHALARVPVDAPPDLVDSVMRTVSAELRPSRRIALDGTSTVFVTETAIGNALRTVLDDEPAVLVRRVRVEQFAADRRAGSVRVRMSVAVSYERFTRDAAELVRGRVVDALRALFDLHAVEVDVEVVDVITRPADPDGGR